ncbi:CoA-binding protein [Falsirhodobacter halotolerans]|uniref:CoA-binding protein n=1 Tax=Falsirhodobacter halotolerans TaxID=1146892 RepID=UPI001FD18BD3|nr:CoA-binding protein [Falsirhodobacter halotolerans]MCJ8140325.1 CoA-binding protein [Falsirhodobacter halotolerans]
MDEDLIRSVLLSTRSVAVVGWSANPDRASHRVAAYLKNQGYRVIPVNPGQAGQMALGERVIPDLTALEEPVDMVDIFRRSDDVLPIVEQAVQVPGIRTIWMQLGIENAEARALAERHGLGVIENRCPAIEIPRLIGALSR